MSPENRFSRAGRRILRFFNVRNMAILLAALLLLCLIPMYAISAYNHPSIDDYGYGKLAHEAWEETGSVFAVLKAAGRKTAEMYHGWQGSFSAILLMALQPGVWGESMYFLSTVILLTSFLAASALFLWVFLKKTLRMDGWSVLLIGSVYALLSTQFLPSAAEAFYWFNGSVYYTFFFSLSLIYASLIMLRCFHGKRNAICAIAILLLSIIIGGGNYVTFLLCAVLLAALVVYQIATKRVDWVVCAALALLLAAFLVSYASPGNSVRARSLDAPGFFAAIALSFMKTANFFAEQATLPAVLAVLFTAPVLAGSAAASPWRFRFPPLVTLGSFALIYIGFFPSVYAQSFVPDRIFDVLYYMLVVLLFVNAYYYLGWLCRVLKEREAGAEKGFDLLLGVKRRLRPYLGWFFLCAGLLTVISCCSQSLLRTSAVQATLDIVSGDAAQYDRERKARLAIVESTEGPELVFPALSAEPETLFIHDLTADPNDWRNLLFAWYWDKTSVIVE